MVNRCLVMFQDTATESDCCSAIDDTQFSKLVSLKGATMAAAEAFGSDQPELAIEKICLDQTGDCEKGLSWPLIKDLPSHPTLFCQKSYHII